MLIVTIAALVMAASLGGFAYRLMREEQRRAEARVAVLTAALDGDYAMAAGLARTTHVGFVAPAATPGVVFLEDDSRQVRAFRSEHGVTFDDAPTIDAPLVDALPLSGRQASPAEVGILDAPARSGGLFADGPDAPTTDLRRVIALGGIVCVSLLAVAYLLFGRPAPVPSARPASTPAATTAVAAAGIPLELRALAHERTGDGLVVRGRVKNPAAGSARPSVVASVMLLDQAGGFLGSARTPVEVSDLRPGLEAAFAVELPAHKDGRRYRVTFRGPDGALVPHVDKR